MNKKYLGDGVYISFDGYHFILTVEDGTPVPTNTIYLEPTVMFALLEYEKDVRK